MATCKPKTRHIAEVSMVEFFRRNPASTYFLTFTEPSRPDGVALWTKDEAESALKPFIDRLHRESVEYLVFWERQKRGSWHPHILLNHRYLLGCVGEAGLRDWMMKRGWGVQMKAVRVYVPQEHTKCRDVDLQAGKLVSYLLKYLTKGFVDPWEKRKKMFSGSHTAKCGNVKFRWLPEYNAAAYLYFYGRQLWRELYGSYPDFRDTSSVVRHGVEACDWASVDPLWMFSLGG